MKGQFFVVSAIVIGVFLVSAAAVISETKSMQFDSEYPGNTVSIIEEEVERTDFSNGVENESFNRMLDMMEYRTEMDYDGGCQNITLEKEDFFAEVNC